MYCKKNNFCAVKGLVLGFLFLFSVGIFSYSLTRDDSSDSRYITETSETQKNVTRETSNSSNITINFDNHTSNAFVYLIQILFWAFLISPPIIVVLLLVIIKKMNDKSSIK